MYSMPELLHNYMVTKILPLGMVDDIISVTSVEQTEAVNKTINTFTEHKKIELSHNKCYRIHVGKGHKQSTDLFVHAVKINEAEKEKYLG